MTYLNEDTLVQQTTADYLSDKLGWDSVYAYNQETFGTDGLLGRDSDREVVLTRYLKQALQELNKGLPESAYDEAVRQVVDYSQSQSLLSSNLDKYKLFKDGVLVSFQGEHGEIKKNGSGYLILMKRPTIIFGSARIMGTRRSLPPPD